MTDIKSILESSLESLQVDDSIAPSQWAEQYRVLSGYAAEPGAMRVARAPYQREWLDITRTHQNICIMKSAQVGGTETYTTLIGYYTDTAKTPTPIMVIHPTIKMAEKFSKDRIVPMFRDSPRLVDRLDMNSRNADNAMLHKRFKDRDVTLDIVGSNSPASLASQTIRILIADEIDKYPNLEVGDALTLAEKRTQTFKNAIRLFISTPTIKGRSRIEKIYSESDQRQYHVPCPDCDHEQTLVIDRLIYDEGKAKYLCESCNAKISEHHKQQMLDAGHWVAKFPKRSEKMVGYHINELYSPWSSWQKILDDFHSRAGNDALLMPFYNEVLGLPYNEVVSDSPDWSGHLNERIPRITDTLPENVICLTAACDVQRDRLEVLIVGWYKRVCTIIERVFIPGNTQDLKSDCWQKLTELYQRRWDHPVRGQLRIRCIGIDSGDGNSTNAVYSWARKINVAWVMILKGMGLDKNMSTELGTPSDIEVRMDGSRYQIAHKLWPVNTHMLKSLVYATLSKPSDTNKFIFSEVCDDEFFKQLTAETLVKHTDANGDTKLMWKKTYKENHALDMVVYNYAIYYLMNLHNYTESKWESLKAGKDIERKQKNAEEMKRRRMEQEMRRQLFHSDPLAYFTSQSSGKKRNWWDV
jgi:phage terminase large subunit GpA-like protein